MRYDRSMAVAASRPRPVRRTFPAATAALTAAPNRPGPQVRARTARASSTVLDGPLRSRAATMRSTSGPT